jgi:hypothetical protein
MVLKSRATFVGQKARNNHIPAYLIFMADYSLLSPTHGSCVTHLFRCWSHTGMLSLVLTGEVPKVEDMFLRNWLGGDDMRDLLSGVDSLIQRGIADPSRLGVTVVVTAVSCLRG